MMKLQKWSSLNKAEKLGRKNALKATLIYAILVYIMFSLVFLFLASTAQISFIATISSFLSYKPPFSLLLLVIIACTPIFYYFMIRKDAIDSAYKKCSKDYSKKLAEEMLVRGKPTKVKLLKTRDGHYSDFLLKDLPGRVDYYAVLEENHNIIVIYPKFSDENEKDFFDDISNERRNSFDFIEMEEFSSFCEIVDN